VEAARALRAGVDFVKREKRILWVAFSRQTNIRDIT